jgi:hypothetical protein
MKINEYLYKLVAVSSAIVIFVTLLASSGTIAESTPLKLTKEDAKKLVLEYSPIIKGLEKSQKDLAKTFTELSDSMEGLRTLYGFLPRYKHLYNLYQSSIAIPNYQIYLETLAVTQPENMEAVITTLFGTYPNLIAATQPDSPNMKIPEYFEYQALKPQFALLGIINPNLSNSQEYEIFVSPLVVTPMNVQTGVLNLTVALESTKAGLASGATTLYNTLIMLEGFLELQEKSYAMAVNDTKTAKKRFDIGRLSQLDYSIAQNKEAIARLHRDSMRRDVENLTMQFNVMMGLKVSTKLELTESVEKVRQLNSLDSYVIKALKERNEIKTLNNNRQNTEVQFEKIKDFYSSSNPVYKIAEAELKDNDREKQRLVQQITLEIHKAYLDVIEKEAAMEIKKASMEDVLRQHKELKKNVELGFVTSDVLLGLDLLVIQATNDYYTANRNYIAAYAALEGASSIGPAYKN